VPLARRRQLKRYIAIIAAIALLSGCGHQQLPMDHGWTWRPGSPDIAPLGQVAALCSLTAGSGGGGGIFASGSPRFVGAVVGGYALLDVLTTPAIQQSSFDLCMQASGYVATRVDQIH
jgi:hypothetical protein